MTNRTLRDKAVEIVESLRLNKIMSALEILKSIDQELEISIFRNKVEQLLDTYSNVLKFSFEYAEDPDRNKILQKLKKDLLDLSDLMIAQLAQEKNIHKVIDTFKTGGLSFPKDEKQIDQLVERLLHFNIDQETDVSDGAYLTKVFNYTGAIDSLGHADEVFLNKVRDEAGMHWSLKSMAVSGMLLSILRFFDPKKILWIIDMVEKKQHHVWQRAFVVLMFVLFYYDRRLKFYPELMHRIKIMEDAPQTRKHIELFAMQYTWQKESERISKKIQEELLPDVMKIKSELEDKLDLNDIQSPDDLAAKNPDWQDYFKDSPEMLKRFENVSKLHQEGADIFMSAFSMLKQFPFFITHANWFIPFDKQHPIVKTSVSSISDQDSAHTILEAIEGTGLMCNSDKYSFVHNLALTMSQQGEQMMELFKQEMSALNEMSYEQEDLDQSKADKNIMTQYLQDLYRFFKLNTSKDQFVNIFHIEHNLFESEFISWLTESTPLNRRLAEFYFEQEDFEKALPLFVSIKPEHVTEEVLEKIGYLYQKLENYHAAIEYYEQVELIGDAKPWLQKQLALCYHRSGALPKALNLYQKLSYNQPDDVFLKKKVGHLSILNDIYDQAVKIYFELDYLHPNEVSLMRPLAWALFMEGKLDEASKVLDKILKFEVNKNDFMNAAHVSWCKGDQKSAVNFYKQSYLSSEKDLDWFERILNADAKYLKKFNISEMDIGLLLDYIKYVEA